MDPSPNEIPVSSEAVPEKRGNLGRVVIDIIETLLLSVILFIGINAVSARVRVDGSSMEPTLHNGELVIVNRLAYQIGKPKRGEVVVFRFPRDPRQEFIKRVIGLPGDVIAIRNGKVYVNEQLLTEPYIAEAPTYEYKSVVPANQLFVLGDNRNNSDDSHEWGMLPMEYMIGKAVFIYWPFSNLGVIKNTLLMNASP